MQPTLMHFLMDVEASSHYNNSKLQHALNYKTYPVVQQNISLIYFSTLSKKYVLMENNWIKKIKSLELINTIITKKPQIVFV